MCCISLALALARTQNLLTPRGVNDWMFVCSRGIVVLSHSLQIQTGCPGWILNTAVLIGSRCLGGEAHGLGCFSWSLPDGGHSDTLYSQHTCTFLGLSSYSPCWDSLTSFDWFIVLFLLQHTLCRIN